MKTILICFAGRIASGKTTLSQAVAENLEWPRVGFGDCVRMEARRKGLDETRNVLQNIGESLVEDPDEFCRLLLQRISWEPGCHMVIEGIRHTRILDSLRRITAPSKVLLIFIETKEQILKSRLAERYKQKKEEGLLGLESHSTEREVLTNLPDAADLIVDGSRSVEILVRQIMGWLPREIDFGGLI